MREAGDGPAMSVMTYPDPEHADKGFFMLVMAAPERDASAPSVSREITIVLDRSGSMQGEKFAQATGAAKQIINALEPDEAFRIVDYAAEVSSRFRRRRRHPDKAEAAIAYLDGLQAVGGTNINEALLTALREPVDPERCRSCSS
jgi:Ca-activated chloride channel family protein